MSNKVIAVCINEHPKSRRLLRTALNKSRLLKLPWEVIYIETTAQNTFDHEARERVLSYLTLAEKMGADIQHIESHDVYSGICHYIYQSQNTDTPISQLIIGKTLKEGIIPELRKSLSVRLTDELDHTLDEIQIIPLGSEEYQSSWLDRLSLNEIHISQIIGSVVASLIAVVLTLFSSIWLSPSDTSTMINTACMIFLMSVLFTAMRYGLLSGLMTTLFNFIALLYFFIPPPYSLLSDSMTTHMESLLFLLFAIIMSICGAYNHASIAIWSQKLRRSQAIHQIQSITSDVASIDEALDRMHSKLINILNMEVAFFLGDSSDSDDLKLVLPKSLELSSTDQGLLKKSWSSLETTGFGTISNLKSHWRFEPMITNKKEIGVIAFRAPVTMRLDASFGRLMTALADQAAAILERIELGRLMSESQIREEREKLRAMLLSSVSHDLKTPLASIIGSLSVLKRMKQGGRLNDETADELNQTALDEAIRLDSFISNILDMTRIESGDITFEKEWVPVDEPINAVLKRLRHRLGNREVVLEGIEPTHEVQLDRMMSEQVLQNLIDNAIKYSPDNTSITISGEALDKRYRYSIRDRGAGIPRENQELIFDKYERLKQKDNKIAGTGLGLAISRAVMIKQGGYISVSNHTEGGAVFTLDFPIARRIEHPDEVSL